MANEQMFRNRATNYVKGRFGYAQEVINLLCNEILKPNDKIADVGSGTGIFAQELIERGFDVFCIEPNNEMRMQAEKRLSCNPHFKSIPATAEATTLPIDSIDVVTAASAFHWFDVDKFYKECKRILKKNGILFTVINSRTYNDSFTMKQHEICKKFCPYFKSLRHGLDKSIPYYKKLFGHDLHYIEFDFPLEYTKEKFVQRSLSSSYAPESNIDEYVQELWNLVNEFAPNSNIIEIPNFSVVYWGKII